MVIVMINRKIDAMIFLIENCDSSISDISRGLNIDYKNTHNIIKKLEKEGIISLRRIGRLLSSSVNKKMNEAIFSAEYERRRRILKKSDMKILSQRLESLKFFFVLLIFGSYAKGTSKKSSDIDVMAICDEGRKNEIRREMSLMPLDIHLSAFTPEEFRDMLNKKEFSVVSEAARRNIILIGIEDYYRMIEDAEQ